MSKSFIVNNTKTRGRNIYILVFIRFIMKKLVLVIAGILLVVAITLSFFELTGLSVKTPSGSLGNCIDSDSGQDYYTTGTAKYENRDVVYTDYCFSRTGEIEKWLNEYYCMSGNYMIKSKDYLCPNGCIDGACAK